MVWSNERRTWRRRKGEGEEGGKREWVSGETFFSPSRKELELREVLLSTLNDFLL